MLTETMLPEETKTIALGMRQARALLDGYGPGSRIKIEVSHKAVADAFMLVCFGSKDGPYSIGGAELDWPGKGSVPSADGASYL